MSDSNALLAFICLCYIVILASSVYWFLKPPKNINSTYGYRTPRSMKTIESWRFANKLAAKLGILIAHINLLLSLWVYHIAPKFKYPFHVGMLLICVIPIILGLLLFLIVEHRLKRKFVAILFLVFSFNPSCSFGQHMTLKAGQVSMKGILEVPKHESNNQKLAFFIAGSGPMDMDGNGGGLNCNNLKMLSGKLLENGIATFRFDKRVADMANFYLVNESNLRIDTFVKDVISWIKYIRMTKPSYKKIYLIGHSEGSLIAGIVANISDVSGVVSIGGAGRTADKIIIEQIQKNAPRLVKESSDIIDTILSGKVVVNVNPMLLSILRPSVQPYLLSWFKCNPANYYRKINRSKKLIVHGANDSQLPSTDAILLSSNYGIGTLHILKNMNHLMKEVNNQKEDIESYVNPDYPISKELVGLIVKFIKAEN